MQVLMDCLLKKSIGILLHFLVDSLLHPLIACNVLLKVCFLVDDSILFTLHNYMHVSLYNLLQYQGII